MAQRISVHEVLRKLARQIMGYIDNIKRTMSTNPDLSKFVDEYIRGFIGFHMDASRYRLSELDIPELAGKSFFPPFLRKLYRVKAHGQSLSLSIEAMKRLRNPNVPSFKPSRAS
jgi:hypothetical protein